MTHNQIEYWNLQETKRHNLAGEGELSRHNVVTEGETYRHNVVGEQIEIGKLGETVRHNLSTEAETSRHNRATEDIGYGQLAETVRHNQASETIQAMDAQTRKEQLSETQRHNQAAESIDRMNATSNAVANATKSAGSWLSTNVGSTSSGRKATGTAAIVAGVKAASKKFTTFSPILVPKTILQPLNKSGSKGVYSS